MSERRIEEIMSMFKQSAKPKLIIEDFYKIERIGCIVDSSPRGERALEIAIWLTKRLGCSLRIFVSEDYHTSLSALAKSAKQELDGLIQKANERLFDEGISAKVEQVLGKRTQEILAKLDEEVDKSETLVGRLISRIIDENLQIVVIGAPLFKNIEDPDAEQSLGRYIAAFLRERSITANFLLVPAGARPKVDQDSILGIISVDQQPSTQVALIRRALSFATTETHLRFIGIVEDRVIETYARAEASKEDPGSAPDLERAARVLRSSMEETLNSIAIAEGIPHGPIHTEVITGSVASIVRYALDMYAPNLVIVRSVADLRENLDPFAEVVTRQVLASGYPCLVVWD